MAGYSDSLFWSIDEEGNFYAEHNGFEISREEFDALLHPKRSPFWINPFVKEEEKRARRRTKRNN
jgi:hypothetical protein